MKKKKLIVKLKNLKKSKRKHRPAKLKLQLFKMKMEINKFQILCYRQTLHHF